MLEDKVDKTDSCCPSQVSLGSKFKDIFKQVCTTLKHHLNHTTIAIRSITSALQNAANTSEQNRQAIVRDIETKLRDLKAQVTSIFAKQSPEDSKYRIVYPQEERSTLFDPLP
jgi:uncharacterized damage-inducible protein DinB